MNKARPVKDWAVLAYVVGDDKGAAGSLDDAIASELQAICNAADFAKVSVAVQADFKRTGKTFRAVLADKPVQPTPSATEQPQDNPLSRKISDQLPHPLISFGERVFQRIKLKVKTMLFHLTGQTDSNAASRDVLQEFLRFGREQCPARRYFIYFFGHAFGPMGLFYDSASKSREPNSLRLNDLADAIGTGQGRAAIVLFRDCFMSTLETAFQLQSSADFVLASQAEAPIAGVWPWDQFMAALDPDSSSLDVGKELARRLTNFLKQDGNRGPFADVPYALLDLSAAPRLIDPLTALVHELERARSDDQRRKACAKVLEGARIGSANSTDSPGDPALIDVATICSGLQALSPDPVGVAAKRLADVLPILVQFSFTLLGHQKGVALYYQPFTARDRKRSVLEAPDPDEAKRDHAQYEKLGLCQQAEWGRFALNPLSPS